MSLSIGHRILLGFTLVIGLAIGLAIYELNEIGQVNTLANKIVEDYAQGIDLIQTTQVDQKEMQITKERAFKNYLLSQMGLASGSWTTNEQEWQLATRRTETVLDQLLTLASANQSSSDQAHATDGVRDWGEVVRNAQQQKEILTELETAGRDQFNLMREARSQDLADQVGLVDDLRTRFDQIAEAQAALVQDLSGRAQEQISGRVSAARSGAMIGLGIVIVLALAAMFLIHRSIAGPLSSFVHLVERVGQGDLKQRSDATGKDEIGRLGQHFNRMVESLVEWTQQTRTAATEVNTATASFQAASQQQAASASETGAAIQQITVTLGEVAQSGREISERANKVAASAEQTSAATASGLEAVAKSSKLMKSISDQAEAVARNIVALTEKTQSIGDIIANVNDISERSELLALNAAIEASAAGEEGQSFTVIAAEMKNLAIQAKEATQLVRGLLKDIQQGISAAVMQTEEAVKRTESGQLQTEEATRIIQSLAESVEQSVATFQHIVAATNQQQIGIEQVTQSIQDIRTSSEQVASGTRDLEGSASNLSALGMQLQRSLEGYAV